MMSRKKRGGQAVLEFALVFPIFLLVFFTVIDFGRAFHIWFTLKNQCVEAAKVAGKRKNLLVATNLFSPSTHTSQEEVLRVFWDGLSPLMTRDLVVGPTLAGVGAATPTVTISAGYRFSPITPFIGDLVVAGSTAPGDRSLHFSVLAAQRKE